MNVYDLIDTAKQDKNAKIQPGVQDRCFICNKPCENAKFEIHLGVDDELYTEGHVFLNEDDNMGFFSVGTECAKLIPAEFRIKL